MKRISWSLEEDEIICRFYLTHKNANNSDFKVIYEKMLSKGYNRSFDNIKMRYLNYKYIDTGIGLSHINKKEIDTYNRLKEEVR